MLRVGESENMYIEMKSIHSNELENSKNIAQLCFKTSYNEDAEKEARRMAKVIPNPCIAIVHDKNADYMLATDAGIILFNAVHPTVI